MMLFEPLQPLTNEDDGRKGTPRARSTLELHSKHVATLSRAT